MKKIISLSLILAVLLCCLTACNFTQNLSGAMADNAEATPKVEEMMAALANDNTAVAKALLHPQVAETSEDAITQMIDYLAGRKPSAIEMKSININTSTGTAGKTRQEQVSYQITLTDGTVIFLDVVYLSNKQGIGFTAFQLGLGVA